LLASQRKFNLFIDILTRSSATTHTYSAMSSQTLARTLQALHQPGNPLILSNVYDILSARAVASLPSSKALATASYAIAAACGTTDEDLDLDSNLAPTSGIVAVAKQFSKPLTVDIQDGYGDSLEKAIAALIEFGVVGVNLEDCDKNGTLYSPDAAVDRIQTALAIAETKLVPDFVVNARCDVLVHGGKLEEVFDRGKRYLAAGATTVFVWGGSTRGVSRQEVQKLVKDLMVVSMSCLAESQMH
jgi:2-methylisocitrate lyase-like PEP mutase family enzyme